MTHVNRWGKTKTTVWLLALRVVTALVVVGGAVALQRNTARREQILSLRAHLPEYVSFTVPSTGSELPQESNAPTYRVPLVGKVVPVNAGTGQIDGLYDRLPATLRPQGPAEVRTVATIDCQTSATKTTRAATTGGCTVAAFDLKTRALIGIRKFKDAPPSTSTSRQATPADVSSSTDVIAWLEQLQTRSTAASAPVATERPCSGIRRADRLDSDGPEVASVGRSDSVRGPLASQSRPCP
jgi:hypothetical protein